MITIYELQDVQPIVDLYVYSYLRTCAAYDSTVKSMGFDEIRVRYRQQRREFIREIILKKFSNKKTKKFLEQEIPIRIPEEEREEFLEDILEDLDLIDESRIAGLGITMKSLQAWKELYNQ